MSAQSVAGLAVVGVGLLLMLVGLVAAWLEARRLGKLGGASDFVDALARLVKEVGEKRTSVILFTFGTLLVFLGGLFLGVSELKG